MKKKLWIIALVVVALVIGGSGWAFNVVQDNRKDKAAEALVLQQTFIQQYGEQAKIEQLVSPSRVFAAMWEDAAGVYHISWNVGGLWVTVWSDEKSTETGE